MNLYQIATWIAIPLLGLGSITVFLTFLIQFLRHQAPNPENPPPTDNEP
ncbi:MAG: hypothetical protein O2954_16250 [bacterium]|nr:hypothetical protein [bacterium]